MKHLKCYKTQKNNSFHYFKARGEVFFFFLVSIWVRKDCGYFRDSIQDSFMEKLDHVGKQRPVPESSLQILEEIRPNFYIIDSFSNSNITYIKKNI